MPKSILSFIAILLFPFFASAGPLPASIDGWSIQQSPHPWQELGQRVSAIVKDDSPLNVLSKASATVGAKNIGKEIKGNMVIFVYAPQFAVRMLDASIAAGIEAPLRIYITEQDDGGATLSYKYPSSVFAPYEDGGEKLKEMAAELDQILADIASKAITSE